MIRPTPRTRALLVLIASFVGGLSLAVPVSGQETPPSPDELASALARPALVYLETFWTGYVSDEEGEYFNDGEPLEFSTSCTGFVVNPAGYIATAGHCVDDTASFGGAEQRLIELAAEEAREDGRYEGSPSTDELVGFGSANWTVEGKVKGGPIEREVYAQRGRATPGERAGSAMPAAVVDYRSADSGDIALLRVNQSDLPTVVVSNGAEPSKGTPVLSAGYPLPTDDSTDDPIEPRVNRGEVTAAKEQGDQRVYELTAAVSDGMSGGPTVNLEGQVIGVNSFRVESGDTTGFIVSGGQLREVMARNEIKSELGRVDELYRQGLNEFYAGRMSEAAGAFDQVLELDPEHTDAKSYLARARPAEPVAPEPEQRSPVLPLGFGLALLVMLGGTLFLRASRRHQTGAEPPTFS